MIKASDDFKKLLQNVENYANNKLMFEALGDNEKEFYEAVLECVFALSELIAISPSETFIKTQKEELNEVWESYEQFYQNDD